MLYRPKIRGLQRPSDSIPNQGKFFFEIDSMINCFQKITIYEIHKKNSSQSMNSNKNRFCENIPARLNTMWSLPKKGGIQKFEKSDLPYKVLGSITTIELTSAERSCGSAFSTIFEREWLSLTWVQQMLDRIAPERESTLEVTLLANLRLNSKDNRLDII